MDSSTPMTRSTRALLRRRAALIAWVAVLTVAVIFDAARMRDDSGSPNYPLVVGLGLLAGLGLGVGVAFVWDRYTGRLKRISDVERATGLRVLAMIPTLRLEDGDRVAVTSSRPVDGVEAYGQLAAGLVGTVRDAGDAQCLLVTSPTRTAGRTTIAVNLAASFAAEGMNVALVSADPRGGPVDRMFELEPGPGLTDVVDGSSTLEAAMQASGVERLSILGSGRPKERGAVGYNLDELAHLLDRMARDFDLMVIDAPPVLGSLETVLLAQDVDLVLFAVDVRHGRRSDASVAMSYLGHVEDRLVGAVANDPGRPRRTSPLVGMVAATQAVLRKRNSWVAVVAVAAAAALVVSTAWWLSEDGRSQAKQNRPERRLETNAVTTAETKPNGRTAVDAAIEECRSSWDAQSAPLEAAAASLDQWQVHVDAMNQLVAGEITLGQANAFWEQTRVQAAEKVHRFHDAESAYTGGDHACEVPGTARGEGADLAVLSACEQGVAQRDEALEAARVSIETWHHHVMDMEMLRVGKLSPDRAVRLWLKSWEQGVADLEDYRSELRNADRKNCSAPS